MRHIPLAAALLSLGAAAHAAPPAAREPARAVAVMHDGAGAQVGTATLAEDEDGVRIAIVMNRLPPGSHAFRIHAVGRCDGPDFASAGARLDPGQKAHGPAGTPTARAGDLPDLVAGADGVALIGFIARGVSLGGGPTSLLGGAGASLVVSTGAGDGRGKSGASRLACGVVRRR